jgi:anti-sigma B factor antagonist
MGRAAEVTVMKIDTIYRKGQVTVSVCGEVDMSVQKQLMTALSEAASQTAGGRVVVDLSHTSFLDSSGIAALVTGMRAASEAGAVYRVTGATGLVQQVLTVTGVLALLTGEAGPAPA